jgi:coproporphyrinogen III oxidase-like Fe-S oxidoreductase
VITNNPLETEEDCKQTLDLLLSMPRGFKITNGTLSLMSFFPNYALTKEYEKVKSDRPLDEKRYAFFNRLYLLAQYLEPSEVRRLAASNFYRRFPERLQSFFPGDATSAGFVDAENADIVSPVGVPLA